MEFFFLFEGNLFVLNAKNGFLNKDNIYRTKIFMFLGHESFSYPEPSHLSPKIVGSGKP
jgi:hypothetical protein